jgi:hypothetical protein
MDLYLLPVGSYQLKRFLRVTNHKFGGADFSDLLKDRMETLAIGIEPSKPGKT